MFDYNFITVYVGSLYSQLKRELSIPAFTSTKGLVEVFASPEIRPECLSRLH